MPALSPRYSPLVLRTEAPFSRCNERVLFCRCGLLFEALPLPAESCAVPRWPEAWGRPEVGEGSAAVMGKGTAAGGRGRIHDSSMMAS